MHPYGRDDDRRHQRQKRRKAGIDGSPPLGVRPKNPEEDEQAKDRDTQQIEPTTLRR
jgi:hypothetical protein